MARRASQLITMMLAVGSLACGRGEPLPLPAAYVPPRPGTVYHYTGFTSTITQVDGMRTRFVDDSGRAWSNVALFIGEDPRHPVEIDAAEFAKLWPLRLFRKSELTVRQAGRDWKWAFEVVGAEVVTVPAGAYETYVIRGVQGPATPPTDSAAMREAPVVAYMWWYAPSIGAIVRFWTRQVNGPGAGRTIESELTRIVPPGAAGAPARAGG